MAQSAKKHAVIITVAIVIAIAAVCTYVYQLKETVSEDVILTMEEISCHDAASVETTIETAFSRLEALSTRLSLYEPQTLEELQEQLNVECAAVEVFDSFYLLDENGTLYTDAFVIKSADRHEYDEIVAQEGDRFTMRYDEPACTLEVRHESVIHGIRFDGIQVEGINFVALIGRYDIESIDDKLRIESFNGRSASSVIDEDGYYVVNANRSADIMARDNFYEAMAGAAFDDTNLEGIRYNISCDETFVTTCTTAEGEQLVFSFMPIADTDWSLVMELPESVFQEDFTKFIVMALILLTVIVAALFAAMASSMRHIRRGVEARVRAEAHSSFLSSMSHEIRTPLNGIIGLSHLMAKSVDDPERMAGYVKKLDDTAKYLLSLVNDILDFSKMQAGKFELLDEPFELESVVEDVCGMYQTTLDEKGIEFARAKDITHGTLVGDKTAIEQILMNILSNASKFTPRGGRIEISVSQESDSGSDGVITRFAISDTGCGMSKEFQSRLFDAFSQERTSTQKTQKGTGLGMSICYLLTQQMGGDIQVESEVGKGTCFTVSLPLPLAEEVEAAAASDAAEAGSGVAGAGAESGSVATRLNRILVAEDTELNAEILMAILEEAGFTCQLAVNGQEAVEVFEASEPGYFDLILMDVHMPIMDGYEATTTIRKLNRPDAKSVKIFACTASAFQEDVRRAQESGMDDFLSKPINVPVMLKKLNEQ